MEIKVVFLSNPFTGRTSIFDSLFQEDGHLPNRGHSLTQFRRQDIRIDSTDVSLSLWDVDSHERFRSMIPAYVRGADIVVIVISSDVFECKEQDLFLFYEIIQNSYTEEMPKIVVVRNKCDLSDELDKSEVASFCREVHAAYFETSLHMPNTIRRFEEAFGMMLENSDFDVLVTRTIAQLESQDTDVPAEPTVQARVTPVRQNNEEQRRIVRTSNVNKEKSCI